MQVHDSAERVWGHRWQRGSHVSPRGGSARGRGRGSRRGVSGWSGVGGAGRGPVAVQGRAAELSHCPHHPHSTSSSRGGSFLYYVTTGYHQNYPWTFCCVSWTKTIVCCSAVYSEKNRKKCIRLSLKFVWFSKSWDTAFPFFVSSFQVEFEEKIVSESVLLKILWSFWNK